MILIGFRGLKYYGFRVLDRRQIYKGKNIVNNTNIVNNMVKKTISITLDEKVFSKWKEYTEKECINASKLIEKFIVEHLKKRGEK
jgi:preprotein translocase subunit SecD